MTSSLRALSGAGNDLAQLAPGESIAPESRWLVKPTSTKTLILWSQAWRDKSQECLTWVARDYLQNSLTDLLALKEMQHPLIEGLLDLLPTPKDPWIVKNLKGLTKWLDLRVRWASSLKMKLITSTRWEEDTNRQCRALEKISSLICWKLNTNWSQSSSWWRRS